MTKKMEYNTIVLRSGLLKGYKLTEEFADTNSGIANELSDLLDMQTLVVGNNLENRGNKALIAATTATLKRCVSAGLRIVNATDGRNFGSFSDVEQAVRNR